MAMQDNFGNPQGLLGRMMLSGMNLGHTSMAEWGLSQLVLPQKGNAADIGCGGGYNVRRLLRRIREGRVHGVDISPVSVKKSEAVNKKDLGRRCEIHQGSADALPSPTAPWTWSRPLRRYISGKTSPSASGRSSGS